VIQRHLVIMLKTPRPGRVKTRLGRGIGNIDAVWWFRHQTARLTRNLSRDPRWQTWLAISPDPNGPDWRHAATHRISQGRGDLGARMGRVFRTLPPGPTVIIGGDIPGISPALIQSAFQSLGTSDATFGPATDGGYWLIGLARRNGRVPQTLFQNVRWSSPDALADTIASLGSARHTRIATLQDVDTSDDLAKVRLLR